MVSYKYFNGNFIPDDEYKFQVRHEMNVPEKIHPIGIDYQIMTAGLKDNEVSNSKYLPSDDVIEGSNQSGLLISQSLPRSYIDNESLQSELAKLSQQIKCLEEENGRRTRKEFWIYTAWLGLITFEIMKFVLGNR